MGLNRVGSSVGMRYLNGALGSDLNPSLEEVAGAQLGLTRGGVGGRCVGWFEPRGARWRIEGAAIATGFHAYAVSMLILSSLGSDAIHDNMGTGGKGGNQGRR